MKRVVKLILEKLKKNILLVIIALIIFLVIIFAISFKSKDFFVILNYKKNIEIFNEKIIGNLTNFYKDKDTEELENYIIVLDDYVSKMNNYYELPNIVYNDTRMFKDMYHHFHDLSIVSENFTKASINTFFKLTLPVHIYNYEKEEHTLPAYGYTQHKFPQISDLTFTYYVDKGYNYSPLAAIRTIEKEQLLVGEYDQFKKLYSEIIAMMEARRFNDIDYIIATYYFTFNNYPPGWTSGMAQGVMLDITATAYYLTNDPYYYDMAQKILPAFLIDYKDGGLIYNNPNTNKPFLLEYAYGEKERELNGSIIGAIGLRNWYKASGDLDSLQLYKDFIQEILYVLPDYDYPMDDLPLDSSWSKYSLTVFPVQKAYHTLHINLLATLQKDDLIKDLECFDRIEYYLNRWTIAYRHKYPEEDIDYLFETNVNSIFE